MKPLTIVIPTYNRKQELENTLKLLTPQVVNEKIVILDNCSDYNIQSSNIMDLLVGIQHDVIVNKVNLGLSGNFLRAFEICETEYIWILSDDDSPCANSLNLIRSILDEKEDDFSILKFSSSIHMEETPQNIFGRSQFLDYYSLSSQSKFSNLIFISNTIFKTQNVLEYLREGYHFSNTHAPHIAIILSIMLKDESSRMLVHNKLLVDQVAEVSKRWTLYKVYLGFSSFDFMSLNLDAKSSNKFLEILHSTRKYYRTVFVELYKLGEESKNFDLSKRIFKRIFFGIKISFLDKFMIRILYLLIDKPYLINIIRKFYPRFDAFCKSFELQTTNNRL